MKVKTGNYQKTIIFLLASLFVAICSHIYFIYAFFDGRYMLGVNDGLSQMMPFKTLLYDQYREGNFFYSNQFGMGGGTYSQLGYYFSNSIVFYLTALCLFLLEKVQIISQPDIYTWMNLILPISIIRQTIIILCASLYFRCFNLSRIAAFCGAVIYGTSVMYFRHVTYWEFFADAMIWLPLLLLGMEKIIKDGKTGLFIFTVTITLFDNFYFAYIHCLVMLIYLIFRWIIPLHESEMGKWEQLKKMIAGSVVSLCISAVSFIPAVYGYLNNHRIAYEKPIALFGVIDNPLLFSRLVYIPAFAIICLFVFSFYKNKLFRFFAFISFICFLLHLSPKIASAFNGFSAPQYRWEYFLSLMIGGVVAVGIDNLYKIDWKKLLRPMIYSILLYSVIFLVHLQYWEMNQLLTVSTMLLCLLLTIFICFTKKEIQILFLIMSSVTISFVYQQEMLSKRGNIKAVTNELIHSDEYNGKQQRELLDMIKEKEEGNEEFYRIDWMIATRNNTPIVQDFNGFSVYSSILNKHLLYFYLYDLEIDMKRESVSRYMTLGDRANLFSKLSGKYLIIERGKSPIPYGFTEVYSTGKYIAYENENLLPFLQATSTIYSEEDSVDKTILEKEHMMLDGLIVDQSDRGQNHINVPNNLINETKMEQVHAIYKNDVLEVTGKTGGIDFYPPEAVKKAEDVYLGFTIERIDRNKGYTIQVNEYETTRKKQSSIYKTGVNNLTIRVQADEKLSFRLPKGTYQLSNLDLYGEDYQLLKTKKAESTHMPTQKVKWEGNQLSIEYDNQHNDAIGLIPVPYEKGWNAKINGKKAELIKANYAFIGIPLVDGYNDIQFIYTPPYFKIGLIISLFTLIITLLFFQLDTIKNR